MKKNIKFLCGFILLTGMMTVNAFIASAQNMPTEKILKAVCLLYPTQGNNVTGKVTFTPSGTGLKVVADIEGLTPGKHGFHIHECGDCSAPDGTSAAGHFNPDMKMHSSPTDINRHEGDLGNIQADASGKAHLEYVDPMLSFEGAHSIIGRSVIIHKDEDDMKTQPTGNAGARVACGVIGISK
jgi:superoxide dismutase, Cu-Zn family